nr:hypothetical protein [Tanacetum cinerariifolium]
MVRHSRHRHAVLPVLRAVSRFTRGRGAHHHRPDAFSGRAEHSAARHQHSTPAGA